MNDIENNDNETVYPSLMNRIQAMFFDFWIIVAMVMFLSVYVFEAYAEQFNGFRIILFFVILFIYEPIGSMSGGSIGYRTMGMKIRRSDGVRKISFIQAYLRAAIKLVLGGISFLTIGSDKQNQAIHDKAAKTLVMYTRS